MTMKELQTLVRTYPVELELFDKKHPALVMTAEEQMALIKEHSPMFVEQE